MCPFLSSTTQYEQQFQRERHQQQQQQHFNVSVHACGQSGPTPSENAKLILQSTADMTRRSLVRYAVAMLPWSHSDVMVLVQMNFNLHLHG